jgi:hypothetical protein
MCNSHFHYARTVFVCFKVHPSTTDKILFFTPTQRINLKMNPRNAAAIVALRPAIENMLSGATENPEGFFPLNPLNEKLVSVITSLSRLEAAKFGEELEGIGGNRSNFVSNYNREPSNYGGRPPQKRMMGSDAGSYQEDPGDEVSMGSYLDQR